MLSVFGLISFFLFLKQIVLFLHCPLHDLQKGIICKDRHQQKIAGSAKSSVCVSVFPHSFIIYSQSIRSLAATIGMMDGSTSAAAKEDTAMHHSIGKTIEQTNHRDSKAGRGPREFTWVENQTAVPWSYVKYSMEIFLPL